jgi:hypothetical protein
MPCSCLLPPNTVCVYPSCGAGPPAPITPCVCVPVAGRGCVYPACAAGAHTPPTPTPPPPPTQGLNQPVATVAGGTSNQELSDFISSSLNYYPKHVRLRALELLGRKP